MSQLWVSKGVPEPKSEREFFYSPLLTRVFAFFPSDDPVLKKITILKAAIFKMEERITRFYIWILNMFNFCSILIKKRVLSLDQ